MPLDYQVLRSLRIDFLLFAVMIVACLLADVAYLHIWITSFGRNWSPLGDSSEGGNTNVDAEIIWREMGNMGMIATIAQSFMGLFVFVLLIVAGRRDRGIWPWRKGASK
jgi:hypothetical protein